MDRTIVRIFLCLILLFCSHPFSASNEGWNTRPDFQIWWSINSILHLWTSRNVAVGTGNFMENELRRCLKSNWGHERFRPYQLEVHAWCVFAIIHHELSHVDLLIDVFTYSVGPKVDEKWELAPCTSDTRLDYE